MKCFIGPFATHFNWIPNIILNETWNLVQLYYAGHFLNLIKVRETFAHMQCAIFVFF